MLNPGGERLSTYIGRIITLIIALTIHELAHAWTADQLGDDTPRLQGRLTFNPLAHLDPMGSLFLLITGFGWARPVMVNPYALRRTNPAGTVIVAAAGPFSNLLLAILAAIPFRLGLLGATAGFLSQVLQEFILINLVLLFFNLIPIFPLDGEKVADYFLPPQGQRILAQLRPYGMVILIGLIVLGNFGGLNILGLLVSRPAFGVFHLLVT